MTSGGPNSRTTIAFIDTSRHLTCYGKQSVEVPAQNHLLIASADTEIVEDPLLLGVGGRSAIRAERTTNLSRRAAAKGRARSVST